MIRSELPIPSNFQNVEISVVMIVLPASSQIICNTHFTLLPINWCAGKIITQIKYDIMTWFLIWIFFLSKLESHWWVFLHPFNFLFLPSFLDPHTSYGISKKERGKKIILPSGAAALEIISSTILFAWHDSTTGARSHDLLVQILSYFLKSLTCLTTVGCNGRLVFLLGDLGRPGAWNRMFLLCTRAHRYVMNLFFGWISTHHKCDLIWLKSLRLCSWATQSDQPTITRGAPAYGMRGIPAQANITT